jgi:hypothetical protein
MIYLTAVIVALLFLYLLAAMIRPRRPIPVPNT